MNKRYLHHIWRYLRRIHPWYFVALTLVFGLISLFSLRHNNEQMVHLRNNVYVADKNNGDVEAALRTLRTYVYAHMNTSLASGSNAVYPPIQLKYTYQRLQTAAQTKAGNANSSLYTDAEHYCEQKDSTDFYGYYRLPCINDYVTAHGAAYTPPAPIPDAFYKFDFTAARWSADLAGWSLVASIISAILLIITTVYRWWAKKYL
jgi:hypothetical protein